MKKLLYKQGWHLLGLVVLLAGVNLTWNNVTVLRGGEFLGLETGFWFWLAIAVPIVHQLFVLIVWRGELHTNWVSKRLGSKENAYRFFTFIFFPLLAARPISILLLASANRDGFAIAFRWRLVIGLLLFAGFAWLMFSVIKYFGIENAAGRDHFFPEEYRGIKLESRGIYHYVDNAMYVVGFFMLWFFGVVFASPAALVAALFNHAFIWVFWFTLEKPDMEYIYSDSKTY